MNPCAPIREQLEHLAGVIRGLDDSAYGRIPSEGGGSIGAHVRHCLDHVEALLGGAAGGRLDYDRRSRGSLVEARRDAALETIERLDRGLAALEAADLARPLAVVSLLAAESPPAEMTSTLGREIAYVASHTTHHNALIGWLARAAGQRVPDGFGYAAATLAWLREAGCAP